MTSDFLKDISTRSTPQTERADPTQVENNAGGFVFEVTPETRLRRFLTLGTDSTYYANSKAKMTKENAAIVIDFAKNRTADLVRIAVEISEAGRAPKQNGAIFALAAAAGLGDKEGRAMALEALPRVARTATTLFLFLSYVQQFRGWGRGLRTAVGKWYTEKDLDKIAYQMTKYRNREGWTHRDALRQAHPIPPTDGYKGLFAWATGQDWINEGVPPIVEAFIQAQEMTTAAQWVNLIESNPSMTWEMFPDAALSEAKVWGAMLDQGMPIGALIRQLPRLTRLGLFDGRSEYTKIVADQLANKEMIQKARIHPINVLIALKTYSLGRSLRGSSTWTPKGKVTDALDSAFYTAFGNVRKTGLRYLLALDVSGSMGWANVSDDVPMTPREISGAIALVTAATEPDTTIVGFSNGNYRNGTGISELNISPRQRLDDVTRYLNGLPFGGTDCSLPARWALDNGHDFDSIAIYTDSETYAGREHPYQVLKKYRQQRNLATRQIVVGMEATNFTIADPRDNLSIDVAGFDSATPNIIADFSAGVL